MKMNRMKRIMLVLAACMLSLCNAAAQTKKVLLETTKGDITIMLYDDTPVHRDNFVRLVQEHFYDSLLFHRVIWNFMVQAGDPQSRNAEAGKMLGGGDLGYTLEPEFRTPAHYHRRGAVAMAREGDRVNPERRSSACQFYIVWGQTYSPLTLDRVQERLDQQTGGTVTLTDEMRQTYMMQGGSPHLDGQYTVFGEVVDGLNIVDSIQNVDVDRMNRPLNDVRIISARVVQ